MTPLRIALACLAIAPALGGCGRDPLVYGPFLVGAERPAIRDGVCCPKGDIRSQDAHGYWVPCEQEKTYCHASMETAAVDAGYVEDLKAPPYQRAAPTARHSTASRPDGSDPRSAW